MLQEKIENWKSAVYENIKDLLGQAKETLQQKLTVEETLCKKNNQSNKELPKSNN